MNLRDATLGLCGLAALPLGCGPKEGDEEKSADTNPDEMSQKAGGDGAKDSESDAGDNG